MKKFAFSLEKLRETKEMFEEAAQRRLAEGLRCLQAAREDLARSQELLQEETERVERMKGCQTNRNELLAHVRYRHSLEQMSRKQAQDVAKYEAVAVKLRETLREAMKARQCLENLKTMDHSEWVLEVRRTEQKEMDEISVQRFMRRPQVAGVSAR